MSPPRATERDRPEDQVRIRSALPEEGERLREIVIASKRYWGYDQEFMSRFAAVISMSPGYVRQHDVWVLEHAGRIAGLYGLIHQGEVAQLDHLWLLPRHIGNGFGRILFEHAVMRAAQQGARRLEWDAETHAVGFYERMGGRPARETTSQLGRTVQVFGLDLLSGAT